MHKVLFVCHGNICRSPMAEFIMKYLVKDKDYYIDSSATTFEEIGDDIYYAAKASLDKHLIPYEKRKAKRITKEEYAFFDYIIAMDDENIYDIKRIVGKDDKTYKLMSFCNMTRDVRDPWYTRQFEECFEDLYMGCVALFKYIEENDNK